MVIRKSEHGACVKFAILKCGKASGTVVCKVCLYKKSENKLIGGKICWKIDGETAKVKTASGKKFKKSAFINDFKPNPLDV